MCNGRNKERMMQLVEQVPCEEGSLHGVRVVYYARRNVWMKIMSNCPEEAPSLVTDHMEADTEMLPHSPCTR